MHSWYDLPVRRAKQRLTRSDQYEFSVSTNAVPGNELGLYESDQDTFNQENLNNFFAKFEPYELSCQKPRFITY